MPVIQSEIDAHSDGYAQNRDAMLAAIASFREVEQKVLDKANEAKPKFIKRGQLLPRERIARELAQLQIAIDKTASAVEHEAWGWLQQAMNDLKTPMAGEQTR